LEKEKGPSDWEFTERKHVAKKYSNLGNGGQDIKKSAFGQGEGKGALRPRRAGSRARIAKSTKIFRGKRCKRRLEEVNEGILTRFCSERGGGMCNLKTQILHCEGAIHSEKAEHFGKCEGKKVPNDLDEDKEDRGV